MHGACCASQTALGSSRFKNKGGKWLRKASCIDLQLPHEYAHTCTCVSKHAYTHTQIQKNNNKKKKQTRNAAQGGILACSWALGSSPNTMIMLTKCSELSVSSRQLSVSLCLICTWHFDNQILCALIVGLTELLSDISTVYLRKLSVGTFPGCKPSLCWYPSSVTVHSIHTTLATPFNYLVHQHCSPISWLRKLRLEGFDEIMQHARNI